MSRWLVGSSSSSTVGSRQQHAGQQRARRLAAAQLAERRVERDVGDAERVARAVELGVQAQPPSAPKRSCASP